MRSMLVPGSGTVREGFRGLGKVWGDRRGDLTRSACFESRERPKSSEQSLLRTTDGDDASETHA